MTDERYQGEITPIRINGLIDSNLSKLIRGRWFTESVSNNDKEIEDHGTSSWIVLLLNELYPGCDAVFVQDCYPPVFGHIDFNGDTSAIIRDIGQSDNLMRQARREAVGVYKR